jgi:DNA polymerase-3 subunit gamma/tau
VPDYSAILEELLSLLHALSVRQQVEDAPVQVEVAAEQLASLAELIPAEELQLYYQLGLHGRRDLPLAPTPRIGLEMAFLRMLAFQPERSAAVLEFNPVASAGAAQSAPAATTVAPRQSDASAPPPLTVAEPEITAVNAESAAPDQPAFVPPAVPSDAVEEIGGPGPVAASEAPAASEIPEGDVYSESTDPDTAQPDWSQLAYALSLTGLAQQLAAQLALVKVDGNQYQFTLDTTHRAVLNRTAQSRLEQALVDHAGQPVKVVIEVVRHTAQTPAGERERLEQQRLDETTRMLQEDRTVQALAGTFGAQLDPGTIQPLDQPEH